jgi:N-acetylneuraminic acid mutarotase
MAHSGTAIGKDIIYVGGQLEDKIRFSTVAIFRTDELVFEDVTARVRGVVPRFARHSAVAIDGKAYIFGGFNGFGQYYELAVFDPVALTWTYPDIPGPKPIPRTNHSATVLGKKMYLFGGNYTPHDDESYTILSDFWVLDTETMRWREIKAKGDVPGARTAHTLIAVNGRLFLYGGGIWEPKPSCRWIRKFNDMYCYDPEENRWTAIPVGNKINICSFPLVFAMKHWIFFFGGMKMEENAITNNMYCFDTVSWECHKLEAEFPEERPLPRDLGTAVVVDNKIFIFAGSSGMPVDDIDVIVWQKDPPAVPME